SSGSCVKTFAPGVAVTSAWATSDSATMTLDGTSMATAVASGIATVYLNRAPDATPAEVMTAVTGNATTGHVLGAGTGSPNALAYAGSETASDPGVVIAAVGSDATASLMDRVLRLDPGSPGYDGGNRNVHRSPASPVAVPGDGSCAAVTYGTAGGSTVTPP